MKDQPCQAVHDCGTGGAVIEPAVGSRAARSDGRSIASSAKIGTKTWINKLITFYSAFLINFCEKIA